MRAWSFHSKRESIWWGEDSAHKNTSIYVDFIWSEITPVKIMSVYKFEIEILGEWISTRAWHTGGTSSLNTRAKDDVIFYIISGEIFKQFDLKSWFYYDKIK